MKKFFIISSTFFLVFHFSKLALDAGMFSSLPDNTKQNCKKIGGIQGPEDIQTIDDYLFISSTKLPFRHNYEEGWIYYINLNDSSLTPTRLNSKVKISPHGIFTKKINDKIKLWVINHYQGIDSIEIFEFENNKLKHIKTLKSPLLINSNDITVSQNEHIYVSHEHSTKSHLLKNIQNYSRLGTGYITRYNGKDFKKIINGLNYANGIWVDQNKLYVAEMLSKKISVFNISSSFSLEKIFNLDYLPDNIHKDDKELYIAAHPNAFKLKDHAFNINKSAPSSLLRLDLKKNTVDTLFFNHGDMISAASIGLKNRNQYFLGNIYSDFLLVCSAK